MVVGDIFLLVVVVVFRAGAFDVERTGAFVVNEGLVFSGVVVRRVVVVVVVALVVAVVLRTVVVVVVGF